MSSYGFDWGSLRCSGSGSDYCILMMGCTVPVRCKVPSRWFPWQRLAGSMALLALLRVSVTAKPLYSWDCVGTEAVPMGLKSCCRWQNYSWSLKHLIFLCEKLVHVVCHEIPVLGFITKCLENHLWATAAQEGEAARKWLHVTACPFGSARSSLVTDCLALVHMPFLESFLELKWPPGSLLME